MRKNFRYTKKQWILAAIALLLLIGIAAVLIIDPEGKELLLVVMCFLIVGMLPGTPRPHKEDQPTPEPEKAQLIQTPPEPPHKEPVDPFTVAGKAYDGMESLRHRKMLLESKWADVYKDIHGRWVVYYSERYPCFDSYDLLYETRRNHYFLILVSFDETDSVWAKVTFPDEEVGAEVLTEHRTMFDMRCCEASLYHPLLQQVADTARRWDALQS